MDRLIGISNQLQTFAGEHFPPETLNIASAGAGAAVILGILMCVLGAKLARPALTGIVAVLGISLARNLGADNALTLLLGAVIGGAIGFFLFRLWVGLFAALLFSSLAMSVVGYNRVIPALEGFNDSTLANADAALEFTLPDAAQQEHFRRLTVPEAFGQLRAEIQARDPACSRQLSIAGVLAGIAGFLLGVVAVRAALILSTALLGTTMLGGGLFYLAQTFQPQAVEQTAGHQGVMLLGVGAFLLASMLIQTQLTRRVKTAPPKIN